MGKNLHVLVGLTDINNDKIQLNSKQQHSFNSPLSGRSSESETDFQVIKRFDSDNEEINRGSLLQHFTSIADTLQATATSDHTMKSNLDAIINLIKGFQPSLRDRSELIRAWKIKKLVSGQKQQKIDSVNGIEKDNLLRELQSINDEMKMLESQIKNLNTKIVADIDAIFTHKIKSDIHAVLVGYAVQKSEQLNSYSESFSVLCGAEQAKKLKL